MQKKRLFSRIVSLLGLRKKENRESREKSVEQKVSPPPPPEPVRQTSSPTPKQPEPAKHSKHSKPSKPPEPRSQKNKKTRRQPHPKRSREPKIDKKGFRVITDRHDLHRLFGGEEEERKTGETDFARMFEESQEDIYQRRLMQDKKQAEHLEQPRTQKPPSVKIKTYPPPQKELDLHGYTGEEAEIAAGHFIQDARRKGIRTLRIIVGKGLHSDGKAVLPDIVERKVIDLKRNNQIIAYHWEKKDKRKSGAIIVYLA